VRTAQHCYIYWWGGRVLIYLITAGSRYLGKIRINEPLVSVIFKKNEMRTKEWHVPGI